METPSKIYYFFNPFYETSPEQWSIKHIPFVAYPGMPSEDFFRTLEKKAVVIIDDQFNECIRNPGKILV